MPKPGSKSEGGPPNAIQGGGDPIEPGLEMGIRRGGSEGDPLGILGGSSAKIGDPV